MVGDDFQVTRGDMEILRSQIVMSKYGRNLRFKNDTSNYLDLLFQNGHGRSRYALQTGGDRVSEWRELSELLDIHPGGVK